MLVGWSLFDPEPSQRLLQTGRLTEGKRTVDRLERYSVEIDAKASFE